MKAIRQKIRKDTYTYISVIYYRISQKKLENYVFKHIYNLEIHGYSHKLEWIKCLGDFSIIDKTPWSRTLVNESIYLDLWFEMVRVHNSRAKSRQQEQMRAHILICNQETKERTLEMAYIFWDLKACTPHRNTPPPMKLHLLNPFRPVSPTGD